MSETYTLILDSQNATNITNNNNIYSYQYYINWDAILSRHYEKYSLTYTMKSINSTQQTTTFTASVGDGPTVGTTFLGFIIGTTLTVTSITSGTIAIGEEFYSNGILTTITAQVSGTAGSTGVYT